MKFSCVLLLGSAIIGAIQVNSQSYETPACTPPFRDLVAESLCPERLRPLTPYRPINGSLARDCYHPGATGSPYRNYGGYFYADCDWQMRKAQNGSVLPSPRTIVNQIFRDFRRDLSATVAAPNMLCTMMAQVWAHDLGSMTDVANDEEVNAQCCVANRLVDVPHRNCAAIDVLTGDPDFGTRFPDMNCLSMARTLAMNDGKKPTQTKNTVTSFLDASILYGSTAADLNSIRTYVDGKLKVDDLNIMPRDAAGKYFIGDPRVMQTPHLAIHHSIWLREHNRLAGILKCVNYHWDDEKLFQEARRILIAEYQNVIYNQFLPTFFHTSLLPLVDVAENMALGGFTYADMNQAIFRSFHGLIPRNVTFLDAAGVETPWRFHDMLLDNQPILETHYDNIVRGMMRQPANVANYDSSLFSGLFARTTDAPGMDLLSVDINRGRDHGVPPYTTILRLARGITVYSFNDLQLYSSISADNVRKLQCLYSSVHDIDLLVGAMLEKPMEGTLWGPTIQYMALKQFAHSKHTDPYFYTNALSPRPFTAAQLTEIRKFNTNHLFCLNTEVGRVPLRPSYPARTAEEYIDCSNLEPISYARLML